MYWVRADLKLLPLIADEVQQAETKFNSWLNLELAKEIIKGDKLMLKDYTLLKASVCTNIEIQGRIGQLEECYDQNLTDYRSAFLYKQIAILKNIIFQKIIEEENFESEKSIQKPPETNQKKTSLSSFEKQKLN